MTFREYVETNYPDLATNIDSYQNYSELYQILFPNYLQISHSLDDLNYKPFDYGSDPISINYNGGHVVMDIAQYIGENYYDNDINKRFVKVNASYSALRNKILMLMYRYKYKWHALWESTQLDSQYDPLDNVNEIYDETITRTPDLTYTDSNSNIFGQQTKNISDVHGAQSVENETVYGSQSVENETVYGAQSESGTDVHGAQSVENETIYGAQNVENETVYGAQHEENENYHDSQHVETENIYGAQTVTDTNAYGQRITNTETEIGGRMDSDGSTESTHPYDSPSDNYPTDSSTSTHTIGSQQNTEEVIADSYTDTLTKALGMHTDTSETNSNSYTDRNETDKNGYTDTTTTDTATHTDTTTTDSASYTDTSSRSKNSYTDTTTTDSASHTDTTTTDSASYTDTSQVVDSQHTDSFSGTKTETGEEETVISRRRHGNIGVTTSGQLINDFRNTHYFDLIQIMGNDIVNEIIDLNFSS